MQVRKVLFLPLMLSSICFLSYAQDTSSSYESLIGNWQLAGEEIHVQGPLFSSLTLGIDEGTLYGKGTLAPNCPGENAPAYNFVVSGQVNSDGSFLLRDYPSRVIQLEIRGEAPRKGEKIWIGSFTYSSSGKGGCGVSGDFIATQFPQLNGTYSGTLMGKDPGSGVTVSIKIAQERLRTNWKENPSGPFSHYTPLSATITVSGYPGFTSGTTVEDPNNQIGGIGFFLEFPMKDGSKVILDGSIPDISGSSLKANLSTIENGRFIDSRAGTLTQVGGQVPLSQ